jgi:hypothetical protein
MEVQWIQAGAASVAAIGTVSAVVVVLWIQPLLSARRRPTLSLAFSEHDVKQDFTQVENPGSWLPWKGLWLRFRVCNEEGKSTAREVQVVLTGVRAKTGTLSVEPMPIQPLKWADLGETKIDLAPNSSRHIDICCVCKPSAQDERLFLRFAPHPLQDKRLFLRFALYPLQDERRVRVGPGTYEIELELTARNLDAAWYTATIKLLPVRARDAYPDFREHFAVEVPPVRRRLAQPE